MKAARPPKPTTILRLPLVWMFDPFRMEWRKGRIYF